MWNLKNKTKEPPKTNRLLNTEITLVVARRESVGRWVKYMKGIKRYKLQL